MMAAMARIGRPPRLNTRQISATVPRQLKERIEELGQCPGTNMSLVLTEILCAHFGVELDEQNLVVGWEDAGDEHGSATAAA